MRIFEEWSSISHVLSSAHRKRSLHWCWDVTIKIGMADTRQWSKTLQAEWDFASWLMRKGWHDSGHSLGNVWLSPSLMMELYSQACQEDMRDEFFETETSKERMYEVHHFSWLHTKMYKLFWQMHTNTYKLLWPAESHRRCLCQGVHVSVCVCVCEWLSHFGHVQLFTNLWTVGL